MNLTPFDKLGYLGFGIGTLAIGIYLVRNTKLRGNPWTNKSKNEVDVLRFYAKGGGWLCIIFGVLFTLLAIGRVIGG